MSTAAGPGRGLKKKVVASCTYLQQFCASETTLCFYLQFSYRRQGDIHELAGSEGSLRVALPLGSITDENFSLEENVGIVVRGRVRLRVVSSLLL